MCGRFGIQLSSSGPYVVCDPSSGGVYEAIVTSTGLLPASSTRRRLSISDSTVVLESAQVTMIWSEVLTSSISDATVVIGTSDVMPPITSTPGSIPISYQSSTSTLIPSPVSASCSNIALDSHMSMSWSIIDNTLLRATVTLDSLAWVSVGWSSKSYEDMIGTDCVLGGASSLNPVLEFDLTCEYFKRVC